MKFFLLFFAGLHTLIYRLSRGRLWARMIGIPVLLLTTTGRKTGKRHIKPLGYFNDRGNYVIIASSGGSDHHPAWFLNLRANPQVTIQIQDRILEAHTEIASLEERQRLWEMLIRLAPSYGSYEKRTRRVIPMIVLKPQPSPE